MKNPKNMKIGYYIYSKWFYFLLYCRKFPMFRQWYCEWGCKPHEKIRIHDYFSFMINNYPIFVIRKMDNPHSENEDLDRVILIGIFGFTIQL